MATRTHFDAIDFGKLVKPFEGTDGRIYLTRNRTDDTGTVAATDEMPLDSVEGLDFIVGVLTELLGSTPTKEAIDRGEAITRTQARWKVRRDPTNLIPCHPRLDRANSLIVQDVLKSVPLPTDLVRIFLDLNNELTVQLLDSADGRILPFRHPAVRGELYIYLSEKLGRRAFPQEFNVFMLRCSKEGLTEYRNMDQDLKAEFSDREMLVLAILGMLKVRTSKKIGPFEGTQTELIEELKASVATFDLDASGWPRNSKGELEAGKQFTNFLVSVLPVLYARNVRVDYRRSNGKRLYIIRWSSDPIPEGAVNISAVPRSAGKKAPVEPLPGTPDLTEPEQVNAAIMG